MGAQRMGNDISGTDAASLVLAVRPDICIDVTSVSQQIVGQDQQMTESPHRYRRPLENCSGRKAFLRVARARKADPQSSVTFLADVSRVGRMLFC